jgi:hypothetical protein
VPRNELVIARQDFHFHTVTIHHRKRLRRIRARRIGKREIAGKNQGVLVGNGESAVTTVN